MTDRPLRKGDRIKIGRSTYGKVGYVSQTGRKLWYHRDDGKYLVAKPEDCERVHGNTRRGEQTAVAP